MHVKADQLAWRVATRQFLSKKWGHETARYGDPEQRCRYTELGELTGIPKDIKHRSAHVIAVEQIERGGVAGDEHGCVGHIEFGTAQVFHVRTQ